MRTRPAAIEGARGRLHENGLLEEVTGGLVRPGGLALTDRAMGHCGFGAGARVADVGCGAGATVGHLRRSLSLDAVGLDRSRAALDRGASGTGAALVQGSGSELPLRTGSMDGLLMECSLSVMGDPERVLAECWRVLVTGGRLAMTDLYARCSTGPADAGRSTLAASPPGFGASGELCGRHAPWSVPTRGELGRALERRGFSVDVWEDHSRALVDLLVRLVMVHGSLEPFWERHCAGPGDPRALEQAMRRARPGYFLLVAHKLPAAGARHAAPVRGADAGSTPQGGAATRPEERRPAR